MDVVDNSQDAVRKRSKVFLSANYVLFAGWTALLPTSYYFGWLAGITFTGICSVYANSVGHLSAARSDANPNTDQLKRIEEMLEELTKK